MNWILLPPWSDRLILLVGLGLLAVALARWRREGRGGWLVAVRGLVVLALLVAALNPHELLSRNRTTRPRLIVLLDTSASMMVRDVADDTRWAAVAGVLGEPATRAALEREFDLEVRRFDRDWQPADWSVLQTTPRGVASDLGGAVLAAVTDLGTTRAQAGVWVVSDGRATAPGAADAAQLALARGVPLWTWCVGGPVPRRDVAVETAAPEVLAFRGAEVELVATVRATGYPHHSFTVEIWRGTDRVATREVTPDAAGVARVEWRTPAPATGEERYLFRVPPLPDEADSANNERAVFVRSVADKARVLIVEGQPHWDTKFLVQSLKRDPHIELAAIYRLNAARHLAILSAGGGETRVESDLFPRTAAAWDSFDVVIVGRGAEAFFDGQTEALLTDFVARRGGSVVFARGKAYGGRFAPLAKLEPVVWAEGGGVPVRLRPTATGRGSPVFDLGRAGTLDELLERLPALDPAQPTLGEKPLAVVLAAGDRADEPVLIAYQRYGQGKTVSLNTAGLWRWAFRESGQEESEVAYRRFWVSLLQWLLVGQQFLPGADVALTSARRYYTDEQPLQFFIQTRNLDRAAYQPRLAIGDVVVEPRPHGEGFIAEAGPFPPGTYRVTLRNNLGQPAEVTQTIEVVSASVEQREWSADPELLQTLATTSGGAMVTAADVPRLADVVRRWEAGRQLAHRQRPLWDRWWWWTLVLTALGLEWWLRRREGLL